MNKQTEKRVVNIPKNDFDFIKKYCDNNALNMIKWMMLVCKEQIQLHPDPFLESIKLRKGKQ